MCALVYHELPDDWDDEPREDHFVSLSGASWDDYERLLEVRGERSVPRLTYLEGVLEIMAPSLNHALIKSFVGCLVEAYCLEQGIRFSPAGSWTIKEKKEERGAEPDECYIFGPERPTAFDAIQDYRAALAERPSP